MASSTTPEIDVTPAKRFFVEMLTRDIELEDAILDLLDNCVYGALRSNAKKAKKPEQKNAYKGYWANIVLDKEKFSITDNCGGIPVDVAKEYAFKFGRPRNDIDKDLQTVGVYGIGLKRALFKLGRNSVVWSKNDTDEFNVHISEAWLTSKSWTLKMEEEIDLSSLTESGVEILVTKLHPTISALFDPKKGNFEDVLSKKIRDYYAYIIQKGFKVTVNGKEITPAVINTLVPASTRGAKSTIAPYIYETQFDGVSINLVMGMYAQFPSDSEVEDLNEGRRSKNTAGWTIVCNDRVVLSHDTSHRTGWGEAGVPAYHSQFVMLAGVVIFSSTDAEKLPVTTTKRGINLDSPLYASVKNIMREALKHFTSFTYHWKSDTQERVEIQQQTKAIDIREAALSVPRTEWQTVRKNLEGRRYVPTLPRPAQQKTHARLSFERPLNEIRAVALYLEMEEDAKPADVGAAAFDMVLSDAK